MPPKKKFKQLSVPKWVDEIQDDCLYEILVAAHVTRRSAIRNGAMNYQACRSILESADAVMDQIEYGRYGGSIACQKATAALRKYHSALECVTPVRGSPGL